MNIKTKLLLVYLVAVVLLICHFSCEQLDGAQAREPSTLTTERPATGSQSQSIGSRIRAAFFKLIDFKSFKAKFNKHYGSLTEEIARHKLFLARRLKAKLSMMAYQMGITTSHSGINRMSDWTQSERDRLKNKLDDVKTKKGLAQGERKRRSVVDVAVEEESVVTVRPMSEREAQQIGAIKDPSLLDRGLASTTRTLKKMIQGGSKMDKKGVDEGDIDEVMSHGDKSGVRVDLRKTHCLNKPRHQGSCGSCYAFAALAQYEFMYCLAYGKRIKFSEQFIVDCGPEHLQMGGCEGGKPEQVAQFAHVLGLQKRSAYPYTSADQAECPRDALSKVYAKTKSSDTLVASNLDEYEYWLKRNVPLYISFGMDDSSFYDYAGGIDNPTSCDTNGHAMLVVGVGSDEKHGDYFILRNSMGTDWGRSGYYYVYKKAPCWRFGGAGWAPDGLRDMGKNAFSGIKRQEVEHDHLPRAVSHKSKPNPPPATRTETYKEQQEGNNFNHKKSDRDYEKDESGDPEDANEDGDDQVSHERTWTAAPPPKFEWKSTEHVPMENPYEAYESEYKYNFDGDNNGYGQQGQDYGYDNYDSYFDHYNQHSAY